ncbi:unnamed protein product [Eruca vesicaria subsp. sativa]|uniref:Enhancer of polycomb-like protein n=1 Tax=Eruca vesicaria subsp. sativa TaxID=29727 RepID=A0ABC8JJE1_ERUVS|nr:unnamed protein product [Eruca vesicaria subsp. sativa]
MGMRRTTRVFGVAKPLDGARVLRSGRRISHNVDEPKEVKRAKGKGDNNKGEDFTANKRRKVSSESEGDVDKKFGIVYSRKRKSLSNQSSSRKPPQSLKFYSRRKRILSVVPVITLRVVWSCKGCWLSTVFGLVMRYLRRRGQLSLTSLASFFLSQPIKDVFADHGVRFLAEAPFSSRGVCRFFGEMNSLPLFSADFSAIPGCFMAMHLTVFLRVATWGFGFVERYLCLLNNPVEECESESELVLSPPCSPRNNGDVVGLHPLVRGSKLTVGNGQCRNSLGFHGIQRGRRSSLRKRRGGNISRSVLVHKYNVVSQQSGKVIPIPGVRQVCGYGDDDDDSPSFSMPVQYISLKEDEVSRALGRSSAIYDMDSEDEEWLRKQNVQVFGKEGRVILEQDSFELMIDGFEKRCFLSPANDPLGEKATIVASLSYLGRQEVVEAVHGYWLRKKKKRKAPLLRVFKVNQAKKTPLPSKTVFRKGRSFKRQGSQLHRKIKQLNLGAVKTAEQEALEEQEAILRVEETKALAEATMEIAIARRRRAQVLGENADLAVFKATMALKIAEAKKVAEPIELSSKLFLN